MSGKPAVGPSYEGLQRKKLLALLITCALAIIAALAEAGTGSIEFGLDEIFRALIGRGDATANTVLFGIRFPRAVAAILVGAALAMSGAVMQCVLHNPLASASTLGVSQGAAFGAAVGIIVFGGGVVNTGAADFAIQIDNPYIVTLCAFVFGSLSTVVVIAISRLRRDIGPGGLVLAGVAVIALAVTAIAAPEKVNVYDLIFGPCAALIAALGGAGFARRETLRCAECPAED
jgi:iron complex transport system permease protein